MSPLEKVLLHQRNENYDKLTQAMVSIMEMEEEITELKKPKKAKKK